MSFALRLTRGFRAAPNWFVLSTRKPRKRRRFLRATDGAAAVEFGIIAPMLIVLLMGMISYGSYFLTAHSVQQLANDAARAAIAGLDDAERQVIAQQSVNAGVIQQRYLQPQRMSVLMTRTEMTLSVNVSYDASQEFWSRLMTSAPDPKISRTATIRLGGF